MEKIKPEIKISTISLYFSFFPKLLQGPIERGNNLLPQLKESSAFSYQNAREGFLLFVYGLFKKLVIADRLAELINPIFLDVNNHSGIALLISIYLFSFQIYYDFSGYTDMALGVAKTLNIYLTPNFNSPYLATSIQEFWQRWHMSFSRWIMDYLFYPLQIQLRRIGRIGSVIALMITFLLSGLWHGITWGYVFWGFLHGLYLSCAIFITPIYNRFKKRHNFQKSISLRIIEIFTTFNLVSFAWIFFRSEKISDAFIFISRIFSVYFFPINSLNCVKMTVKYLAFTIFKGPDQWSHYLKVSKAYCGQPIIDISFFPGQLQLENLLITAAAFILLFILGVFGKKINLSLKPLIVRWFLYLLFFMFILLSALLLENAGSSSLPFLYFKY